MDKEELNKSFLGSGWAFPPEFPKELKGVVMTSGYEDIEKSLEILLSTSLGERLMHPDYGCDLNKLLFEPLTTTVKTFIARLVEDAILYHEPRIRLNKVEMTLAEAEGLVNIFIDYTVSATNSRHNYVYPFYIKEGTNLSK